MRKKTLPSPVRKQLMFLCWHLLLGTLKPALKPTRPLCYLLGHGQIYSFEAGGYSALTALHSISKSTLTSTSRVLWINYQGTSSIFTEGLSVGKGLLWGEVLQLNDFTLTVHLNWRADFFSHCFHMGRRTALWVVSQSLLWSALWDLKSNS